MVRPKRVARGPLLTGLIAITLLFLEFIIAGIFYLVFMAWCLWEGIDTNARNAG